MSCLIFLGSLSTVFGIGALLDELDNPRQADIQAFVFDDAADARTIRVSVVVVLSIQVDWTKVRTEMGPTIYSPFLLFL